MAPAVHDEGLQAADGARCGSGCPFLERSKRKASPRNGVHVVTPRLPWTCCYCFLGRLDQKVNTRCAHRITTTTSSSGGSNGRKLRRFLENPRNLVRAEGFVSRRRCM